MATAAWLRASPTDPDTALVDDDIRATKQGLDERITQGGHLIATVAIPVSTATENDDGKHIVGVETPSPFPDNRGTWSVYDNTKTSGGGSHGAANPLLQVLGTGTAGGAKIKALNGAVFDGGGVTSGLDPGHLHTQGGIIGGKGGLLTVGYLKPSAFRWAKGATEGTQTITALYARVGTAPTGGTLVIQVRKTSGVPANAADVYDAGDAVSSVLVGTITINAGEFGGGVSGLAVTVADGEFITLKVTTATGTPADLSVSAVVTG